MATRSVRLEDEDEANLALIKARTGLATSDVIKQSLRAFGEQVKARKTPYEIYMSLGDLGEGGWSLGPSTEVSKYVREAIRRKHGR